MGNLCHSTSACHWTRDKTQGTSLRENSSSHDQERVGKASQIRELEAMPRVGCTALSCSERFNATVHFLCVC